VQAKKGTRLWNGRETEGRKGSKTSEGEETLNKKKGKTAVGEVKGGSTAKGTASFHAEHKKGTERRRGRIRRLPGEQERKRKKRTGARPALRKPGLPFITNCRRRHHDHVGRPEVRRKRERGGPAPRLYYGQGPLRENNTKIMKIDRRESPP